LVGNSRFPTVIGLSKGCRLKDFWKTLDKFFMKASIFLSVFFLVVSFSSCATTSQFDAKVETWKGENADMLVQAWGQPDSIEQLHTGNKMFVYARLRHEPITYSDFQKRTAANVVGPKAPRSPASANTGIYIRCATYFEVTRQNIVDSVMFRGDECK
jgi:hypothetical protein